MQAIVKRKAHLAGCGWFWAWAVVGAAGAFGFVSFIGPIVIVPVAGAIFLMTRRGPVRGHFGALTGAGSVLILIAYLHRQGPGETCWSTATSSGCSEHLNPLPWLVVGLICFVAGFVGHARQNA